MTLSYKSQKPLPSTADGCLALGMDHVSYNGNGLNPEPRGTLGTPTRDTGDSCCSHSPHLEVLGLQLCKEPSFGGWL